ncbi:hypothetical protein Q4610_09875 [Sphingobium sp. HBC34]|uniref:DUF11 domain-containing protein n=1 Tax=Sphingobium cyanobacteriorum TaxID=3063954 RepID=A0ABT8ZLD6_9SPHN|nr:hypothetical protein [Sphingobium sp. HBC34]MDO7835354.1 hypothetical protein [Sphingobium sp. HBC34]
MNQALLALAGLAATQPALAQPAMRLDRQIFVEKVTTDINGRSRRLLAMADRAAPGETVVVILNWRNQGTRPVRGFALTRAMLGGASPDLTDPAVQVSIDGGSHWSRFDQLWLPTPLGGVRRAVADDVTHIRWLLPDTAAPGQAGRLSYRATVR